MALSKTHKRILFIILILSCLSMVGIGILNFQIDIDPNFILIFVISVIALMMILMIGFVSLKYLFYAWIISFPFATKSLYDLGFMNLVISRVITFILLLSLLMSLSMRKIALPKLRMVEVLMLVFTVICVVSAVKSNTLDRYGIGVILGAYISPFFGYYFIRSFIHNVEDVKSFAFIMVILSVYLAYVGIFEQIYPGIVFPRYIVNPDEIISNVGRSVGPSLEPVGYGVGLVLCYLFAIYLYFKIEDPVNPKRMIAFLSIVLTPIAIFFTYTRSIWLGFVSSIVVLLLFYPRGKLKFVSLLLILLVVFIGVSKINLSGLTFQNKTEGNVSYVMLRDTIYSRLSMAKTGMVMFFKKPVFGYGQFQYKNKFSPYFQEVGSVNVPYEGYVIHNTFLNILVELGLLGFIPFMVIFFCLIRDAIILYKKSERNKDIAIIFIAATAAFICASMTNDMIYRFANSLLFIIGGIVKAILNRETADIYVR